MLKDACSTGAVGAVGATAPFPPPTGTAGQDVLIIFKCLLDASEC